ncbi:MAG TPA: glutamine--fructose-6-phosphate transaminase (isomerizing) [Candidatus Hydrothermia bacterium]|nr:glutamine--fructose-6-phosphate transaminase (isomerizing) [Candidatus Hydrothermae bacterium]MDD3649064.1 glutamine--fructose-6-phosphate transaminase (isomerizing) [Candidatus Hydrothermia bacterium]MDD5573414.1 glutamine--fructose-6-phosphate transaminase (isomerizing) [Candidatus Hydrothermia bacterium]HOK23003.1 glutamine--fructose-6-phosphate transaminase (isomerizing) [Candidatus Hydrothermia bacterium]HOL23737.1 glutamine--fructose-6-phosphate transaminase (isomerizing) [Candidatus H
MCGFFSIVFKKDNEQLGSILTRAGFRLAYRGYDTVGIGYIREDGYYEIRKAPGKIHKVYEDLGFEEIKGMRGTIQLRWATYGPPSYENAQPHFDCKRKLIGAHNGNIVNSPFLMEKLISKGHKFVGENDGETLVHVVEDLYLGSGDLKASIAGAYKILKGDYAFSITDVAENKYYAVKKGSSLFLGVGEDFIAVSSDLVALLDLTKNVVNLQDGEMVEFDDRGYKIYKLPNCENVYREPIFTDLNIRDAEKGEFPHFMIKEIYEIPEKARNVVNFLPDFVEMSSIIKDILNANKKFITGSGTSLNAAILGSFYLGNIAKELFIPVAASEFGERYGTTLERGDLLFVVTQSGETKDVKNAVDIFDGYGKTIGLINVLGSSIALRCNHLIPVLSDLEISVPATKTFVNQVIALLYLSMELAKHKGIPHPEINFSEIPSLIQKTLQASEEHKTEIIKALIPWHDFYVLGFGLTYPTALEGALKIKEVVYVHAEGMYSAEFKHGPLSIVEEEYPVIFIATKKDKSMILSHMNEVKCRGGKIITIAPEDHELRKESHIFLAIPNENEFLTPILAVIPMQIIAYYMSIHKGIDPDFPKNISKTLTVD